MAFVHDLENALSGFLEAMVIIRLDNAVKKKCKYQFYKSIAYIKNFFKY